MKKIDFTKQEPSYGSIKGTLRIVGSKLYYKYSNLDYATELLKELEKKGVSVVVSSSGWMEVDLFGENKLVKLGSVEIDLDRETPEQIETKLYDFYLYQYSRLGFNIR